MPNRQPRRPRRPSRERPEPNTIRRGPIDGCLCLSAALFASLTMLLAVPGGGRSSAAPVATSLPATASPWGRVAVPQRQPGQSARHTPGSAISLANVSTLREAWAFKLSGTAAAGVPGVGALTAGPVVQGGVVYIQDEDANVYAVALATGKLMWEYRANFPEKSGPAPDGVAVVQWDGVRRTRRLRCLR